MSTPEEAVDHLLLGAADLDRGIEWVQNLTGVPARRGGSHPGVGTRNALLALAGQRYLEIIAPDPLQSTYAFPVDVREMTVPRLITWALAETDLGQLLSVAREAGYAASGPLPGSRTRPDGKVLKWSLVRLENPFARTDVQPFPFFISWAEDSVHPSGDSPTGCELVSLELEHPDPANFAAALRRFGIEAKVKESALPALVAKLRTPKGEVELR